MKLLLEQAYIFAAVVDGIVDLAAWGWRGAQGTD